MNPALVIGGAIVGLGALAAFLIPGRKREAPPVGALAEAA